MVERFLARGPGHAVRCNDVRVTKAQAAPMGWGRCAIGPDMPPT